MGVRLTGRPDGASGSRHWASVVIPRAAVPSGPFDLGCVHAGVTLRYLRYLLTSRPHRMAHGARSRPLVWTWGACIRELVLTYLR